MKEVASSTDHVKRENALSELGTAMAFMPWNIDRVVMTAMEEVRVVEGMELCVEAAAVAGAFEAITKIVDATGQ
jgi:hypothetical protein